MTIQHNYEIDYNFTGDAITNAKEVHLIAREDAGVLTIKVVRDNGIIDDYTVYVEI